MGLEANGITAVLAVVLGLIFLFLLLGSLWARIQRFREKLRYVDMEMQRSSAHDRPLWQSRRRRLWLWLFFLARE